MNGNTELHRQVNPSWVNNGVFSSQIFVPTKKDAGELSVYDGDLISAQAAWDHFVGQKLPSDGTVTVTGDECTSISLSAVSDPAKFAEHAFIDFRGLSGNQCKTKGKQLRDFAANRKWTFQPITPVAPIAPVAVAAPAANTP